MGEAGRAGNNALTFLLHPFAEGLTLLELLTNRIRHNRKPYPKKKNMQYLPEP
jgi:hypothetical protein